MYRFLLSLLVLDAFLLIAVVLLQAGKGGGLAAMGAAGAGTDSLFGSRQAATLLTKATWWTGGVFLALAFSLSLLSGRATQPSSILRGATAPAPATQAPATPGQTQGPPAQSTPVAPAQPTTGTPPAGGQ